MVQDEGMGKAKVDDIAVRKTGQGALPAVGLPAWAG